MKINELIAERQDIDEGIGSFLGKAAGHAVGGIKAAWRDAKQGYKDAKAVWDPKDPPGTYNNSTAEPATTPAATTPAATTPAAQPTAATAPAPAAQPAEPAAQPAAPAAEPAPAAAPTAANAPASDIGNIMQTIDKLDKTTKQQLASELEKSIAAAPATAKPTPAGTTYDPAKAAADKLAKGQADQQQAQQQMAATKQANAATNQQDAAIKAAADAAKAKPPFQQTASDKMAIKAAADKGIREAKEKKLKKKKIVAEFKSNFLGRHI